MVSDALMTIQSQITSTSTVHSAGKVLPKGSMLNPLYVRINYSAASNASGSNTVTFGVSVSYDGGSTWNADFVAVDKAIALSTTPKADEFTIPFQITRDDLVAAGSGLQIRADAVFSGGGSTPTITWGAEMQPGKL